MWKSGGVHLCLQARIVRMRIISIGAQGEHRELRRWKIVGRMNERVPVRSSISLMTVTPTVWSAESSISVCTISVGSLARTSKCFSCRTKCPNTSTATMQLNRKGMSGYHPFSCAPSGPASFENRQLPWFIICTHQSCSITALA